MKRSILLILTLTAFLFSGCLRNLEKEGINPETVYKGRVVDAKSNPLSGIVVRITNGNLTYNSVSTGQDGIFQISVDISKINDSYFIQIGEEGSLVKRSSLKGFGLDVYDYGDIPFENINLPIVETIGVTELTESSFTCKCNVKSKGGSIVTERGLCWSTNIPTINDYKEVFGSGEGIYSCTISNLNISSTTYYARAYAINDYGIGYGEAVEVNASMLAYFLLPSMEFGGYKYHIHPDLGGMQQQQGQKACTELVAYGFDDWFLPNKEELYAISEKTNVLDKSYIYWSSTGSFTDGSCYYLEYTESGWTISGGGYYDPYRTPSHILRIVPVRKDR